MRLAVALATLAAVNAAVTPKVERWANDPSDVLPPGTVTTKGTQFWLDHYPFYFNGANAYWLPQFVHDEGYIQTFEELKTLGVKVLRTWAFSTVTEIPTNNETYYQYWVNGTSFLNYGPSGLERLDKAVKYAEQYDVKLILTLTNNWDDYGGMDYYNNQTIMTNYHTDFYTYQPMIDLYEAYVYEIVMRYRNSSAIFAWELANEPRSNGYPTIARPNSTTAELTKWFSDESAYIKTLDPNHMVCIGDEGYYNWPNNTDYIYNGTSGMDFEVNLKIDTIDFGTFHLYPQSWAEYPIDTWGTNYIQQHINSHIYPEWFHLAESGNLGGIMVWSLGAQGLDLTDSTVFAGGINGGNDTIDNYDIYPNKTEIWDLWKETAKIMDAKSGKNAKST